jgi:hypothetical protein
MDFEFLFPVCKRTIAGVGGGWDTQVRIDSVSKKVREIGLEVSNGTTESTMFKLPHFVAFFEEVLESELDVFKDALKFFWADARDETHEFFDLHSTGSLRARRCVSSNNLSLMK